MKKHTICSAIVLAALLIGSPGIVRAAATWSGNSGPNWNDSGNWDVLPVPSATEALTFAGTLNLNANNDFAANSQFNTLTFGATAGSFVLGGNAIMLGNGTAGTKITNSSSNLQTISLNMDLQQATTVSAGTAGVQLGGNLSGVGGLTSSATGSLLILSGNNSYTGATSITNGTIRAIANVGNTTAGVSSVLSAGSALTLAPTGNSTTASVLQLRADSDTTFATSGAITFNVGSLSDNRSINIDVDNAGSGSGNTLTLGNINIPTAAGTGPNNKTINVTGSNGYKLAIGTLTVSGTMTVKINSTTADLTIAAITNGNAAVTYDNIGSGATIVTGTINRSVGSKNMTITQSGTGSLTLNGSTTTASSTGGTQLFYNLSGGTLNVNNALALGGNGTSNATPRNFNISSGTLDNTSGGPIVVASGTTKLKISIDGNFAFGGTNELDLGTGLTTLGASAGARTITTNGTNALTLAGNIVDGGGIAPSASSVTKEGSGSLVLAGINFYTGGTTVNNGTLTVAGDAVAAQSTLAGTRTTSTTITGLASTANMRVGQAITGTGIASGTIITGIASGTSVTVSQATTASTVADLAVASGSGLGTGAVSVTGGTLLVNSTGNINSVSAVSISGGTFKYDATTALDRDVTLNGGKFSYNSSNNYTGALTFTSGTVGGSNLAGFALSIGANQTMSPGNSTGTMASDATTWTTGGTFRFELNDTAGTAGSTSLGWDLLNAASLNITAGVGEFTIQIASLDSLQAAGNAANFNGANNYSWLFVDAGVDITGFNAGSFILNDSAFTNSTPGTFSISQGDGLGGDLDKLYINYTGVIPEPSTYALLMGGLGLLAFLRRRKQS